MSKYPISTVQAAEDLGVQVHVLRWLVKSNQVVPHKGPRAAYLWSADNVREARALLRKRRQQTVQRLGG